MEHGGSVSTEFAKQEAELFERRCEEFRSCAWMGNMAGLKRLHAQGVPVDARGARGETALGLACSGKSARMVGWLLEKGAFVDAADEKGETPAMRAAWSAFPAGLKLLIEAGCDLAAVDAHRATALMRVFGHRGTKELDEKKSDLCVELLLANGSDLNAADASGRRAEDIALAMGWSMWSGRLGSLRESREIAGESDVFPGSVAGKSAPRL